MEIYKLTKDNLTEKFVRSFIQLIIRDEMPQGSQIPSEAEIAKKFGVSRTVVREGIRDLTALGLINKRQGRLSTIADQSEWDLLNPLLLAEVLTNDDERHELLDDLFIVRRLLEGFAASQAAYRRNDADVKALTGLLAILEKSITDPQTFMNTDIAVHAAIYTASHSMVLSSIMRSIQELLQNSRSQTVLDPESQCVALAQHRTIIDAIVNQNAQEAEEAMVNHLNWSRIVLNRS